MIINIVLQFLREIQKEQQRVIQKRRFYILSTNTKIRTLLLTILMLTLVMLGSLAVYADDDTEPAQEENKTLYAMKVNGQQLAFVSSEEEGWAILEDVANKLLPAGSTLTDWNVAEAGDITFEEITSGPLMAGADDAEAASDTILGMVKSEESPLTITIKSDKFNTKKTKIRIKFKYTKKLYDFQFKLKKKGRKGKIRTRYALTSVNGVVQSKEKMETETVDKGEKRVILTGRKKTPKNLTIKGFKKYKKKVEKLTKKKWGNIMLGLKLTQWSKQFVGNPYKVGGKSLLHGIDCVQFVRALYKHFGIHLPENRFKLAKAGRRISYKNARAGDVVFFGLHPAIYLGNGMIISSKRKSGITISRIGHRKFTQIRRIR